MENVIPSATSLKMFTENEPVVKESPKPKTIRVSKNITKRAVGKTKRELFNKTTNEPPQISNHAQKPVNEVKSEPVKVEKPKK